MANQEHIKWLREGVDSWNVRREQHGFLPDFGGINFFVALKGSSYEEKKVLFGSYNSFFVDSRKILYTNHSAFKGNGFFFICFEKSGVIAMELNTVTKIPVTRLRLDHRDPRLINQSVYATDEAIIARMFRSAELGELLQSISFNGYLDIEPLVVLPHAESDKLIVLEGNRRLAALRLLREPELVEKIRRKEGLEINIPSVNGSLRDTFERISVYCVASREAARSFLGFKHINGPAKWDSYAKARFAVEWYEQSADGDLETIAKAVGDMHETIKRMVSAIYVLDQARKNELFNIEDRFAPKFKFSHLYTALGRAQYMEYLGLDPTWIRNKPQPDPVDSGKLDNLREVLVWIYGSKVDDMQPVVRTQNPDIKRLGEVLANAEGLHVLEISRDLDRAHAVAKPVDR